MTLCLAIAMLASAQSGTIQETGLFKLQFIFGEWKATSTLHMAPNKPKFEISAKIQNSLKSSAIFVDEAYEIMGQKVENHIIIRYNVSDSAYRLWFFSSMNPDPMVFSGKQSSKTEYVLNSELAKVGFGKQPHRLTLIQGKDGFQLNLDVQYGESWSQMTSATYTKR